ncbi:MAG TPA: HAD family hydrolase [Candidatus Caenarcaniphilales bacterium]|nr:HAD family hydrolase [Candidatus Caenarcaniphilales bacterium]
MTERAVFLDKDGTLVRDLPYNVDPARIELVPGALAALATLQAAGYRLAVVTNQSGVARGFFDESALGAVEERLRQLLAEGGVVLDAFLHCPHHPDGTVADFAVECGCRKPRPGLVRRAAGILGVEPAASWFVGDILNDVEAGSRAGCRTVLVDVGSETEWQDGPHRRPDVVVPDLPAAARAILARTAS